ncbi:MAG: invertase recombinase-like protein [Deltaproteobacteria bacterium]|nr:invertase recombinase-like protein [Deltaproteobacteria bacterium]
MTRTTILALCLTALLGACGDDGADGADTADAAVDAAIDTRDADSADVGADTASDTASPADADASDTADTDAADVATDATVDDTAPADVLDAEDTSDAQDTTPSDVADASPADGGGTDTVIAPEDNVVADGSFERWAGGLPLGWVGAATNLASDGIAEDASLAHDGVRACQLVNAASGHKRFTTAPFALAAGRYTCTYWVRGAGEIRNARYTDDYSSYSGYTTVDDDAWREVVYTFNQAADAAAFELVFSVRNTGAARDHLHLDDVRCARAPEPCDTVTCEAWQTCVNADAACATAPGFCADAGDCAAWETCGDDHRCALAAGRCDATIDCDGETPVCDVATHTCVAGDPCAGVTCEAWQACRPADAACVVAPGRCARLSDCDDALPTCDVATHTCVGVDAPANVVPNGGFEAWSDYSFGGAATYLLPDAWYGECDGCTPYFPTTEIAPANVRQYSASVHGGSYACQLVDTTVPADRFVTEPFPVVPGKTYDCAYRVRGKGTYRQRAYCGGWGPDTEFAAVDGADWQVAHFQMGGAVSWCVLVFYASNTDAAADHVQLDDVVCVDPTP